MSVMSICGSKSQIFAGPIPSISMEVWMCMQAASTVKSYRILKHTNIRHWKAHTYRSQPQITLSHRWRESADQVPLAFEYLVRTFPPPMTDG